MSKVFGYGILKSFWVTLRHLLSRGLTVQYPDQRLPVPPRSRGTLRWRRDICIHCLLCEKVCPTRAIHLIVGQEEGKRRIERYQLDYGRCQLCGLCMDVCPAKPVKAIAHTPGYEDAELTRAAMIHQNEKFLELIELEDAQAKDVS